MPDEATAAQRPAETSKQHPAQQKSKPDGSGGSPFSAAADAAWAKDPDWIVPIL